MLSTDVTQEYLQSSKKLQKDIVIRPLPELAWKMIKC